MGSVWTLTSAPPGWTTAANSQVCVGVCVCKGAAEACVSPESMEVILTTKHLTFLCLSFSLSPSLTLSLVRVHGDNL